MLEASRSVSRGSQPRFGVVFPGILLMQSQEWSLILTYGVWSADCAIISIVLRSTQYYNKASLDILV